MDIQQKCLFQSTDRFDEETAKDHTPFRVETCFFFSLSSSSLSSSSYKTGKIQPGNKKNMINSETKRMFKPTKKVIYYVIVQRSIVQLCTSEIVGNIIIFSSYYYFFLSFCCFFCFLFFFVFHTSFHLKDFFFFFVVIVETIVWNHAAESARVWSEGGRQAELPDRVWPSNAIGNHVAQKLYTMDTISQLEWIRGEWRRQPKELLLFKIK